jgi:ketosteroid isomerase-like protein
MRAVEAWLTNDLATIRELFTDDVAAWSPNSCATSLGELEDEFAEQDDSISNLAFTVDHFDVVGPNKAIAEWRLAADHTGALLVSDDLLIEPTGHHIALAGVTVAEFRGGRICAIRNYFDDAALIEQLVLGI